MSGVEVSGEEQVERREHGLEILDWEPHEHPIRPGFLAVMRSYALPLAMLVIGIPAVIAVSDIGAGAASRYDSSPRTILAACFFGIGSFFLGPVMAVWTSFALRPGRDGSALLTRLGKGWAVVDVAEGLPSFFRGHQPEIAVKVVGNGFEIADLDGTAFVTPSAGFDCWASVYKVRMVLGFKRAVSEITIRSDEGSIYLVRWDRGRLAREARDAGVQFYEGGEAERLSGSE